MRVQGITSGTATPISGLAFQMAIPISSAAVNIALDEWGVWSDDIDVADLYARARHRRRFGGHIVSTADTTSVGSADIHVVQAHGVRLRVRAGEHGRAGGTFVSEGPRRLIVAEALGRAGLSGFSAAGVDDADMGDVPRRVHGAEDSVFDIIWALRSRTKIATIDPWREIGIRWVDRGEDSGVTLDSTKRAAFALVSESSRYATAGARDGSGPSHGHGGTSRAARRSSRSRTCR